jgi:hypothetical protein
VGSPKASVIAETAAVKAFESAPLSAGGTAVGRTIPVFYLCA